VSWTATHCLRDLHHSAILALRILTMGAGMIPAPDKQGDDMTDLNELNLDELNSVTGR
jgi:hypothetical protein